eukprot:5287394-Pyramimonas_sp.AAC.1
METTLSRHTAGIARACADDVGASLRRLDHLRLLHSAFSTIERTSVLTLKTTKCKIAPLAAACMPTLARRYVRWLAR